MSECCKRLIEEAKAELTIKDKRIAFLETEITRVFEPTRKFWAQDLELENEKLRKALKIAANQLEGVGLAFKTHGNNLNVQFFIDNCYKNANEAREALTI